MGEDGGRNRPRRPFLLWGKHRPTAASAPLAGPAAWMAIARILRVAGVLSCTAQAGAAQPKRKVASLERFRAISRRFVEVVVAWVPSLGREPGPWTEARPHTGLAAPLLSALRLTRAPPPSERHKSVYPPGFRRLVPRRSLYVYNIIYIYKLRGGLYIYII